MKYFILLSFLLTLPHEQLFADKKVGDAPCAEWLQMLTPESGEWRRISVRYPDERLSEIFEIYAHNLYQSIIHVWDPWFRTGKESDFEKTLDQQWEIIVGKNQESGKTRGEYGGFYEGHVSGLTSPPGRRTYNGGNLFQIHPMNLRNHHQMPDFIADMMRNTPREPDGYARKKIAVKNIPEYAQPKIAFTEDITPSYHFPKFEYMSLYIAQMAQTMSEIRKLARPSMKLIELLGEYYHVGITAEIFHRVNNSLLMSQVNYILMFHGLRGISHRDLDYLAFATSTEEFIKLFKADVIQENPSLTF